MDYGITSTRRGPAERHHAVLCGRPIFPPRLAGKACANVLRFELQYWLVGICLPSRLGRNNDYPAIQSVRRQPCYVCIRMYRVHCNNKSHGARGDINGKRYRARANTKVARLPSNLSSHPALQCRHGCRDCKQCRRIGTGIPSGLKHGSGPGHDGSVGSIR
jgi:hypothetical protein